jgi:DNA-3-methyladenine glycosylase
MLDAPLIDRTFFARPVIEIARGLVGATLLVDGVGGVIVETEAYDHTDPASHSYNGPTPRNTAMFGPPGHAYVYRSYGIHWCLNFVGLTGSAVLIRALQPTHGTDLMAERRGLSDQRLFCAGPGRLCQALAIDISHNGLPLDVPPFALFRGEADREIATGTRIGITRGVDTPWRFVLKGSKFLSKPMKAGV